MDLVTLMKISRFNDNYKHLLVVIDVFSKYVWVEPLKSKTAVELKKAIENIFKKDGRKPKFFQTDKGSEFLNRYVKGLLKEEGVKLFTTYSERKVSVVERVNRTLKGIMFKYLNKASSRRYIDVLPDLIARYNNGYHRSIKMRPNQVSEKNSSQVWINLYGKKIRKKKKKHKGNLLSIGDFVRISIERKIFQKRYEQVWTEEQFIITHLVSGSHPIVYKLKDMNEEPLKGTFYHEEIQKIRDTQSYRIEKVLRKKKISDGKTLYFVSWLGYPASFNSYVREEDLQSL